MFGRSRARRSPENGAGDLHRYASVRQLVVDAVARNPLAALAEPRTIERLTSGEDVTFDELGLDSLARLTLASELDAHGFAISEVDVDEARSIDGLSRRLAASG